MLSLNCFATLFLVEWSWISPHRKSKHFFSVARYRSLNVHNYNLVIFFSSGIQLWAKIFSRRRQISISELVSSSNRRSYSLGEKLLSLLSFYFFCLGGKLLQLVGTKFVQLVSTTVPLISFCGALTAFLLQSLPLFCWKRPSAMLIILEGGECRGNTPFPFLNSPVERIKINFSWNFNRNFQAALR